MVSARCSGGRGERERGEGLLPQLHGRAGNRAGQQAGHRAWLSRRTWIAGLTDGLPGELAYKQLLQVQRGWPDLKTQLELRPVYHRLEARIRAHVLLCWLTLLLARIIETKTGRTWDSIREDPHDLHVGVFTGPAGSFTQTSQPTSATRAVLTALDLPAPKKVLRLDPAT
jgi:hypothetical protein